MSNDYSEDLRADIPLADMIQALRRELDLAQERADGQNITFQTEKIEMELKVAVAKKKKGQAGIEFYVKVGGELERSNETTHTFKLTLIPTSAKSGGRVVVSSETEERPSGLK